MILTVYKIFRLIISVAGITISVVSLIPSTKNIIVMVIDDTYIGNEPYLAAVVLNFTICTLLLGWGLKNLYAGFRTLRRFCKPVLSKLKNHDEVAQILEQKQLFPRQALLETIEMKDKSFILAVALLLGAILTGLLVKAILPEEFFWDHNLRPGYFSFPVFFVVMLVAPALLRGVSLVIHWDRRKGENGVAEMQRTIKTETDMDTIEKELVKSLEIMQKSEKPAFVSYPGYHLNALQTTAHGSRQICRTLVIESQPVNITGFSRPVAYLYILCAAILSFIGFTLLVTLPPDNISVLTVPEIAIDYTWTLIKGSILVIIGRLFSSTVAHFFLGVSFQSVIAYVKMEGSYEKISRDTATAESRGNVSRGSDNAVTRGDCEFNVFIAEVVTEIETEIGIDGLKEKRQLRQIFNSGEAKQAKLLISNAIQSFAIDDTKGYNNLPVIPVKEE